jgi:hypothetical protein
MRQRTQCNENPDFAICEIASESRPSDPEMIRTVDVTPYRSFGDREFKMERTQYRSRFRDVRYHDPIVAIETSSYLDRWFKLRVGVSRIAI